MIVFAFSSTFERNEWTSGLLKAAFKHNCDYSRMQPDWKRMLPLRREKKKNKTKQGSQMPQARLPLQQCGYGIWWPTIYQRLYFFGLSTFQTVIIVSQAAKAGKSSERAKGPKAWIREGTEEEPVDFLDPGVVQRVVGEFCYSQVALSPDQSFRSLWKYF